MFLDGFKYWFAFKKEDKSYYRCRRFRNGCPGKLWITGQLPTKPSGSAPTTNIQLTTDHNHPAETDRGLIDSFRKVLTRRAAAERLNLHEIYSEEATTRHGEAALLYPFATAESAMAKARSKALHNVALPNVTDYREVGEILRTTPNFQIVYCGQRDAFFQEAYTRSNRNNSLTTALVFAHLPTVQRVTGNGSSSLNEILINVTPTTINPDKEGQCLLTVHHLDRTARITPLAYVLLSDNNSPDIYADIFAHLREKLNLIPAVIISDSLHHHSVHSRLQLTYPEASIKANWFEYVGSVSQQLASVSRELFKDKTYRTILRLILVLPFLPADYMAPGLEAIRKWMRDQAVDISVTSGSPLGRLCGYVEATWLRGIGAGRLSMFRVTISGEDHLKEFHKEVGVSLAREAAGGGGGIWQTIQGLMTIAAKVNSGGGARRRGRRTGTDSGAVAVAAIKKSHKLSEAIIGNATEQWITQPIHLRSPLQFLQMASHFITPPFLANVLCHHYEEEEEEKEQEQPKPPEEQPKETVEEVVVGPVADLNLIPINTHPPPVRLVANEPPPLTFLPQILAQAKSQLAKRRAVPRNPKDPPPLAPIIRNK